MEAARLHIPDYQEQTDSVANTQLKIASDLGWRLTWLLHRPRTWEDLEKNLGYPSVPLPSAALAQTQVQKPWEAAQTCAQM